MDVDFGYTNYNSTTPPTDYRCHRCGAYGVKLWREYQTFLNQQSLLCLHCSCEEQNKTRIPTEDGRSLYTGEVHHWYQTAKMPTGHWESYDPAKGTPSDTTATKSTKAVDDKIGERVPAVPTKEGNTFWGYSSVPPAGCEWWYRLPTSRT